MCDERLSRIVIESTEEKPETLLGGERSHSFLLWWICVKRFGVREYLETVLY